MFLKHNGSVDGECIDGVIDEDEYWSIEIHWCEIQNAPQKLRVIYIASTVSANC